MILRVVEFTIDGKKWRRYCSYTEEKAARRLAKQIYLFNNVTGVRSVPVTL